MTGHCLHKQYGKALTLPILLSDDEEIVLAKQRDREIENGEVEPLSHSELMTKLRNAG
jgi:hypothetical protein